MRLLVLHPSGSSGEHLRRDLRELDDNLRSRHGIDLNFVDAPLCCSDAAPSAPSSCEHGRGSQASGEKGGVDPGASLQGTARCWLDAIPATSSSSRSSNNSNNSSNSTSNPPNTQFVGLDASLLHLTQLWAKSVHSTNPFGGILAVGQGAAVAGLLPLLVRPVTELYDGDEYDDEENGVALDVKRGSQIGTSTGACMPLFPGLEFLILVDGYDLTAEWDAGAMLLDDGNATDVEPWFDDNHLPAPASLHIVTRSNKSNDRIEERGVQSARLAHRFGPSAQIHERSVSSNGCGNDGNSDQIRGNRFQDHGIVQPLRKRELNVIGRFLVEQKNATKRRIVTGDDRDEASTAALLAQRMERDLTIRQTRERLAIAEDQAQRALMSHVRSNPPRALMAVIAPDAVGAWSGPKWRRPDMDGGGAPCPADFRKREGERSGLEDDDGNGDDDDENTTAEEESTNQETKSNTSIQYQRKEGVARGTHDVDGGVSRQHPSSSRY